MLLAVPGFPPCPSPQWILMNAMPRSAQGERLRTRRSPFRPGSWRRLALGVVALFASSCAPSAVPQTAPPAAAHVLRVPFPGAGADHVYALVERALAAEDLVIEIADPEARLLVAATLPHVLGIARRPLLVICTVVDDVVTVRGTSTFSGPSSGPERHQVKELEAQVLDRLAQRLNVAAVQWQRSR